MFQSFNHQFRESNYLTVVSNCFWQELWGKNLFLLGKLQVKLSANNLASKNLCLGIKKQPFSGPMSLELWYHQCTPKWLLDCCLHGNYGLFALKPITELVRRVWNKKSYSVTETSYWDSALFVVSDKLLVNFQNPEKYSNSVCY